MTVVGQQRSLEDFVDDAIGALKANLGTALAAQAAKYASADAAAGRSITLTVPRDQDFFPGGTGALTRYPAIEVSVPDLRASNWSLGQQDADTNFNLIVAAYDSFPQQEALYRRMLRYGAAIYDVLAQPHALGTAVLDTFRGAWRFNPETQVKDEIQSGVVLVFGMKDAWLRP